MISQDYPLSQEEYNYVYSKVPRLTVEIIIKDTKGCIYLTKRAIEPCKGQWHLPGGTVRFGELMNEAVQRIAKRELGINVKKSVNVGYIEYSSHFKKGLDSPVGMVFEVVNYSGLLRLNRESQNGGWFTQIPKDIHADQDKYLLQNGYLSK